MKLSFAESMPWLIELVLTYYKMRLLPGPPPVLPQKIIDPRYEWSILSGVQIFKLRQASF